MRFLKMRNNAKEKANTNAIWHNSINKEYKLTKIQVA